VAKRREASANKVDGRRENLYHHYHVLNVRIPVTENELHTKHTSLP
jgi:hypothetical protein